MKNQTMFLLLAIFSTLANSGALAASEGRIAGVFNVSASGSAQYTIPIWAPPGIRAIKPELALIYDSQLSYGLMGPGWVLSGLSVIARCNLTYAQDSAPAPITLTAADGLCLDGNRLRTTGTNTYQTEIANFFQVTAEGTAGNGPSYFTVQGKDGLTYEYGNTTDSKILPGTGVATPYLWALDKVTDRNGNYMTFTYFQSNGSYAPLSIQYAAINGSTSFPYQINFKYTTISAPNITTRFISGSQLQQVNQLANIIVTSSGVTIRQYNLSYTTSSATLRSTLTSIQECGGSAGSDCLPATSVAYQYGSTGIANPTTASGTAGGGPIYSVDVDGDGRKDLVYAYINRTSHKYTWYVQFARGTGYSAPVTIIANTGSQFLIDDFEGTGAAELLSVNTSGVWYAYQWNGTSFTSTATNAHYINGAYYVCADIDGDGRPDLVEFTWGGSGTSTLAVYLSTSTVSGGISFATSPAISQPLYFSGYTFSGIYGDYASPNFPLSHFDFNGDGRSDLIIVAKPPTFGWTAYELAYNGTSFVETGGASLGNGATPLPFIALNFNDDACTDLMGGTELQISQCNGNGFLDLYIPQNAQLAVDWDGDGRTDILSNVGGVWELYRSEGNQFAPGVSTGISVATGTWVVTDMDGDGLDDLVYTDPTTFAITLGLHNGAGTHPDLATSFSDGYLISSKPTYVPLPNSGGIYTAGSAVFPDAILTSPAYIVSSYTNSDGIGGTYTESYSYTGAIKNLQGRGFQGFTTVKNLDSRTALSDLKTFSTIFPNNGMLSAESITQSSGKSVLSASYTLASLTIDGTTNNERLFPYVASSIINNYEVQIGGSYDGLLITTTANNFGTPDDYGNFANITSTLTDQDSGSPFYTDTWTTTTANSISPNIPEWCLNLPTQTTVTKSSTAPGGSAITRTVQYNSPDYTYCRETEKVTEPTANGGMYKVTEDYTYDPATGNLTIDKVTGTGMTARATDIAWGPTAQFPTSITNPLSQITKVSFDPNSGELLSVTDPNNITTSWQYDDFARKNLESRPDQTSTSWAYNSCATAGCVNSNNQMTIVRTNFNTNGTTLNVQNTYLDGLDRPLVLSKQMLDGTYDRTEVQYDSLGRVHLQGMPCTFVSCTQYWTTNSYDILNRLTESQRPISSTNPTLQNTTFVYQGQNTKITDPQSKVSTKTYLVTGALARTKDDNGYYVNTNYDAFGSLLSTTDSLSNTLNSATYKYGVAPFKVTSSDMDLGSWTYTIDPLGELTLYTDAKGQNFSITYDALSRPMVRTEPDLTTTWTWGASAASYNIGKLASVKSVSTGGTYIESYTYDSKTRLSNETITLPNDGTPAFDYAYDPITGLLSTLTYPPSFPTTYRLTAGYTYQYGLLKQIYDSLVPTTIWWQANSTNPRGQITKETTEDLSSDPQIVTTRSYDAVTGWLGSIQTGPGGGTTLQNEGYAYDYMGNVTQRQNNNLGLTENVFYDNLYRLDHSTLGGITNLQMGYDAMGDITSRSDVAGGAAWTYDPVHKHQVTQAGSSSFTYAYDANGNVTSRNGSIIGWTSYNYPAGVATSTESATFDYGPNHQRWRMTYTGPSGTEGTYYATPKFEKVYAGGGGEYRSYIYAGNRPVVIVMRNTAGQIKVRSLLVDHQGSISSIVTDSTGAALVGESFTAYGNRREASSWSGAPTSGELTTMNGVTRQGYTMQTALGSMGLNHMNGRVEDAVTGRFLSPDPYIPNPENTQNWNPYSFTINNPLSFSDPSGFDETGIPELIVAVGGGPEDIPADILAGVVEVASDLGLSSLFGGGGPSLTPSQKLAQAHGINLDANIPQIQVTVARLADNTIPTFFYGSFATSAMAATAGVDPDMIRDKRVSVSHDPDMDTIHVSATALHGFNWWNLIPGWQLAMCTYFGCGAGHWTFATISTLPIASVETGIARGISPLARGGASLTNIGANDALRIQNAATRIGRPITLVGSRAAGTATEASDWDYVINGSSKVLNSVSSSLPGAGNIAEGLLKNIDIFRGAIDETLPSIMFFPE